MILQAMRDIVRHSLYTKHYRSAHGVVLVYDITDKKSFENVPMWMNYIRSNAVGRAHVVLVGNKIDLDSKRVSPRRRGKSWR